MVGVDNSGRVFFSQTAAVGFVLQGEGIKIVLENLKDVFNWAVSGGIYFVWHQPSILQAGSLS